MALLNIVVITNPYHKIYRTRTERIMLNSLKTQQQHIDQSYKELQQSYALRQLVRPDHAVDMNQPVTPEQTVENQSVTPVQTVEENQSVTVEQTVECQSVTPEQTVKENQSVTVDHEVDHPVSVQIRTRLKQGETVAKENGRGILVMECKHKRDVTMLSTRHGDACIDTGKKNRKDEVIPKPEAVVYYNKSKQGIDVSDQMASYHSAVRKSIRWFHKLAVEFLMGTAVVNALVMYNQHCQDTGKSDKQLQIAGFRNTLINSHCDQPSNGNSGAANLRLTKSASTATHHLQVDSHEGYCFNLKFVCNCQYICYLIIFAPCGLGKHCRISHLDSWAWLNAVTGDFTRVVFVCCILHCLLFLGCI